MKQVLMKGRYLYILFCAIFSILSIYAADFEEIMKPGRTFVYRMRPRNIDFSLLTPNDNYIKRVVGDTIINDLKCMVVECFRFPSPFGYEPTYQYYYENDGKLYIASFDSKSDSYVFKLIINMNLEIGDVLETDDVYGNAKVSEIDYIQISGLNLKRIFFGYGASDRNNFCDEMCWIEGIGMIRPTRFPGGFEAISNRNTLEAVVDEDVLFATIDDFYQNTFVIEKPLSWSKMIRDDRVWIYGGRDEQGSWYKSYCRFGDMEMHGLFGYRPFFEFRRDIWNDSEDYEDAAVTDGGCIPEVLLRESVGSVFRMTKDSDVVPDEEYLYYFALDEGYYNCSGYTVPFATDMQNYFRWSPPSIRDNEDAWYDSVDVAGEKRIRYGWRFSEDCNISFIEGIGITENGFLSFFFDPATFKSPDAPRLLEYCDADMNTLHRFATIEDIYASYAEEIADDSNKDSDIMYDLYGRVITDLHPNQVYIRNGKVQINR